MRAACLVLACLLLVGCKEIEGRVGILTYEGNNKSCSLAPISPYTAITADHCIMEGVQHYADGVDARVVALSPPLAVVSVSLPQWRGLELGKRPVPGEDAYMLGFGGFSPEPFILKGNFIAEMEYFTPGVHAFFNAKSMPGMSGGPILNKEGKLISIVQGTFQVGSPMGNLGVGSRYTDVMYLHRKYSLESR